MKTFPATTVSAFIKTAAVALMFGSAFFPLIGAKADTIYVSGDGNIVQKFDSSGNATFFANAGGGPESLVFDRNGNLYVANSAGNTVEKFDSSGQGTVFVNVQSPMGLAFDRSGNLYVSSFGGNNTGTVLRYNPNGQATVFASSLNYPTGLAFDSTGNLFVAGFAANGAGKIKKFDSSGNASVFSSSGLLSRPFGLAFDSNDNLCVANEGGNGFIGALPGDNTIDKINSSGQLSIFADVLKPRGLAFDNDGNLYTTGQNYRDAGSPFATIFEIDPNGNASIFATGSRGGGFGFITIVPEPSAFALMALGSVALYYFRRSIGTARKH